MANNNTNTSEFTKCDRCGEDATLRCTVCKAQRCWDHSCEHFPRCVDDFVVEVSGGGEDVDGDDSRIDKDNNNNEDNNNNNNNNKSDSEQHASGWWSEENIIATLSNAKLNDARRSYQRLIVVIDQELAARAAGLRVQRECQHGSLLDLHRPGTTSSRTSSRKRTGASSSDAGKKRSKTRVAPEEVVLQALRSGRLTVEKLNEVIALKRSLKK